MSKARFVGQYGIVYLSSRDLEVLPPIATAAPCCRSAVQQPQPGRMLAIRAMSNRIHCIVLSSAMTKPPMTPFALALSPGSAINAWSSISTAWTRSHQDRPVGPGFRNYTTPSSGAVAVHAAPDSHSRRSAVVVWHHAKGQPRDRTHDGLVPVAYHGTDPDGRRTEQARSSTRHRATRDGPVSSSSLSPIFQRADGLAVRHHSEQRNQASFNQTAFRPVQLPARLIAGISLSTTPVRRCVPPPFRLSSTSMISLPRASAISTGYRHLAVPPGSHSMSPSKNFDTTRRSCSSNVVSMPSITTSLTRAHARECNQCSW